MKTICWTVSAVRTNGNTGHESNPDFNDRSEHKDIVELGDSPRGGAVFEDGKLVGFVGYDGIEFIYEHHVISVFEGEDEYMKEDFTNGDFGLENDYMQVVEED